MAEEAGDNGGAGSAPAVSSPSVPHSTGVFAGGFHSISVLLLLTLEGQRPRTGDNRSLKLLGPQRARLRL